MTTRTKPTRTKTAPDTRYRVYLGGSWYDDGAAWVRAANRYRFAPSNRIFNLGFRCALRGRSPRT